MPGRIEAVGRLVEDQHLGIAEQRRGDREPLAHPDRVALRRAGRRRRRGRPRRAPRRRAPADGRPPPPARAGGCVRCGPDGSSRPPARRRRGRSGAAARRSGGRRTARCRRRRGSGQQRPQRRCSCRRRWGRGSRSPRPAWTSKPRSATACTDPKRLPRPPDLDRRRVASRAPPASPELAQRHERRPGRSRTQYFPLAITAGTQPGTPKGISGSRSGRSTSRSGSGIERSGSATMCSASRMPSTTSSTWATPTSDVARGVEPRPLASQPGPPLLCLIDHGRGRYVRARGGTSGARWTSAPTSG